MRERPADWKLEDKKDTNVVSMEVDFSAQHAECIQAVKGLRVGFCPRMAFETEVGESRPARSQMGLQSVVRVREEVQKE